VPELLACLAILAVLAAAAYPTFSTLFAREQVEVAADRLAASLALARSTAMSRRVEVTLEPLPAEGSLDHGWQLVALSGGAEVLSVVQFDAPCLTVTLRQTSRGANTLRFTAVGYSRSEQGGFEAATFTLSCRGEQRQVRLGAQGRIRLCNPAHDKYCDAAEDPGLP